MPGIGVINNPRSKQNRKHPERISKIGYMLGYEGKSESTWTFEALDDVLMEFKREDIDILAINGGDGSNHVTLTHMLQIWGDHPLPKISLLRGGTLNTISEACKIKGSTTWLLYNLAEKYGAGEPFETIHRDLLRINDHYGFLFGNGIIANFMDTYYESGTPSPSHGAAVLLRGVGSAITGGALAKKWTRKINARVVIDGEEISETSFTAIMAATIHEIGIGFTPWYRCEDEPGTFHVLLLTGSAMDVATQVPYIYFGRALHPKLGWDIVAKDVLIESEEPFGFTIDGDMHWSEDGRIHLGVGPRVEIIRK